MHRPRLTSSPLSPTLRQAALGALACALLVLGALAPAAAQAQEPAKAPAAAQADAFRWKGEELYYSVEVGGADAARASLRAGQPKKAQGVTYIPLSAKAVTQGFFAKSYPVDDNGDTFIDPKTLLPLKADKTIREDGKERTYKVRYERGAFTADVDRTDGKKKVPGFKRSIPADTHDAVSWLYDLRTRPLQNGDTYTYTIFDGWKISRLHVKVVGRDKAWTPLQTWDSVKIDIERELLTSRWNGSPKKRLAPTLVRQKAPYYFGTVYLSDDAQRIPVRVFLASSKGDSEIKLIKYVAPK